MSTLLLLPVASVVLLLDGEEAGLDVLRPGGGGGVWRGVPPLCLLRRGGRAGVTRESPDLTGVAGARRRRARAALQRWVVLLGL